MRMALLLLLVVGVAARDRLEEECLDTGNGKKCLEEENGGCLDTGGGRECWEGLEAGLALRAWVLSEGGGERQEVINSLSEVKVRKFQCEILIRCSTTRL